MRIIMDKTKLYKLIFIIAVYSAAFTLLLISIKNYTSYLSTYKNNKTTQHTDSVSTKAIKKADCFNTVQIKNNIFNTEFIKNNPYKSIVSDDRNIQKKIAKNVLRLHVIANSDSNSDQKLKLKVRDSILHELQNGLAGVSSTSQAKQYVASQFLKIKNTAICTINKNGYSYSVKVFIKNRYFPVKTYGDLTFPAGYYDALCVEIGQAQGHNWWCVLFPSLCFENETTATVPDESKKKLKNSLSDREYGTLTHSEREKESDKKTSNLQIRSGIYDLFN